MAGQGLACAVQNREGLERAGRQAVSRTYRSLDLGENHQLGVRDVHRNFAWARHFVPRTISRSRVVLARFTGI